MRPKVRAMLVMDRKRRLPLLDILETSSVEVLPVGDCTEAQRMLHTQPRVHVVVTDTALPDGDWRRVLEIVEREVSPKIEVVVACSCLSDPKLWLDVLERGGYDVLVEPYQPEEVQRIVEAAAARRPHSKSHKRKAAGGWTG